MVAEVGSDFLDAVPALRRANNAPHTGEFFRCEKTGGHAICGDHEVFDQILRVVTRLELQVDDFSVAHDRARFDRLQIECAVLVTQLSHFVGRPILKF